VNRNVEDMLAAADAVLAEMPAALRVRLPEITRDGKLVVREVQVREFAEYTVATYAERSGDVGAPFKPVCSDVVSGVIEALIWGEGCGHAETA
jgi:hypothetical protein